MKVLQQANREVSESQTSLDAVNKPLNAFEPQESSQIDHDWSKDDLFDTLADDYPHFVRRVVSYLDTMSLIQFGRTCFDHRYAQRVEINIRKRQVGTWIRRMQSWLPPMPGMIRREHYEAAKLLQQEAIELLHGHCLVPYEDNPHLPPDLWLLPRIFYVCQTPLTDDTLEMFNRYPEDTQIHNLHLYVAVMGQDQEALEQIMEPYKTFMVFTQPFCLEHLRHLMRLQLEHEKKCKRDPKEEFNTKAFDAKVLACERALQFLEDVLQDHKDDDLD